MTLPPADITKEKSLFEIWRASQAVPAPWVNIIARGCWFILLSAYVMSPWAHTDSIVKTTRVMAAHGFPAIIGLLGFLLAGYLVFITVARRDLLTEMAKRIEEESSLSWLKYNLYPFVAVLYELFIVSWLLLLILVLGSPGGPASRISQSVDPSGALRAMLARVAFVATAYSLGHALIALKSTIRNVHHVIATSIRWEIENEG